MPPVEWELGYGRRQAEAAYQRVRLTGEPHATPSDDGHTVRALKAFFEV